MGLSQLASNLLFELMPDTLEAHGEDQEALRTIVVSIEGHRPCLSPVLFEQSFHCSKTFHSWWQQYFSSFTRPLEDCLQHLRPAAPASPRAPKRKGTFIYFCCHLVGIYLTCNVFCGLAFPPRSHGLAKKSKPCFSNLLFFSFSCLNCSICLTLSAS